jgi:hypothetical protein
MESSVGRNFGTASAEAPQSTPQQIRQRLAVLADQLEGQGARLSRVIDHLVGSTPREVAPTMQAGIIAPQAASIWQQLDQLDHLMARLTCEIDRIA